MAVGLLVPWEWGLATFFRFFSLLYPHFPGSASLLPGNLSSFLWPSPATSHRLCHWLPSSSIKSLYPSPMPVPVPHVSTLAASFLWDVLVSSLSDVSLRRWHTREIWIQLVHSSAQGESSGLASLLPRGHLLPFCAHITDRMSLPATLPALCVDRSLQ